MKLRVDAKPDFVQVSFLRKIRPLSLSTRL
jgi:hypothetical protein